MAAVAQREGRVEVEGGSVWYRIVGEADSTPLVTLHGGPGYPSVSLQPLEALADERPVAFYDQLGCGNSDRPDDAGLWTVGRFVDELETLIDHLGFDEVHLFGHSWGTLLAVEFYLSHRERVDSMVLLGPLFSTDRWTADCDGLISQMPEDLQAIHADPNATEDEVNRLNDEFKRRHIFRPEEEPEPRKKAREGFGLSVYNTMWGPNEFTPTGTLRGYDSTTDLRRIDVPVLFACGRYDEATPESTIYYASLTPDAQVKVFEGSAHFAQLEDTDDFIETVGPFLASQSTTQLRM